MTGNRPRLSLLLRLLHREYAVTVEEALADAGFGDIGSGDAKIFPFVPAEGIAIRDLAARAGVRKQTMAQSVGRLEQAGYLRRHPNPADGRSQLIVLTARGQAVAPAAAEAGDAIERRWAELTSPEDLAAVRTHLHRLLERLARADQRAAARLTSIEDLPPD